ncbi:arsenate reductase (glutaredoxin) [Paraburkholderia kururiensis]|uniref:arsenate reductase (glutaredoxin) n=1 Tax=Paraburkholderia kururiensis TaxID=984307 RepID=UPI000B1C0F51|nr:arsenate reductase (glutaredoxin) [Paraburkholderia kururiensis]
MITIYHNPRCSKSRGAYELVAGLSNGAHEKVEIIEYLKHPLSVVQLKELNRLLACPVRDMVRTAESEYKALSLDREGVTDDELYDALAKHPVLLQRPIIVRNGRAVIGRPPESVSALFD